MTLTDDAYKLVARTTAEQGLPATIEDPALLRRVTLALLQRALHDEGAPKGAPDSVSRTGAALLKGGCHGR